MKIIQELKELYKWISSSRRKTIDFILTTLLSAFFIVQALRTNDMGKWNILLTLAFVGWFIISVYYHYSTMKNNKTK